jgi:hypothetical protein
MARQDHPLYKIYLNMKYRCHGQNATNYKYYGGRGIKVCPSWLGPQGFDQFVFDMGPRPEGTSLDRVNNDGPYSPDNCRWATYSLQSSNRRPAKNLTGYTGVYKTLKAHRYQAQIRVDGKMKHLGTFDNPEEAHECYLKAKAAKYPVVI